VCHSATRALMLRLRGSDPLDVTLFREHALREIQPLLDVGQSSLHILERVESRLNVVTAAHPFLQLFHRPRQVAPPPRPALPIGRSQPPRERFADRAGQHDERHADRPLRNTEHLPPPLPPYLGRPPPRAGPPPV